MQLTYVRLLEQERQLYRLPRDFSRFQSYLQMTLDSQQEQVELPTLIMNPMAGEHVAAHLDALLALDAEGIAEEAMHEAARAVENAPGAYRVALVVPDDLKGGWTNRYSCEYAQRKAAPLPPGQAYFDWIPCMLWVSEPPSVERIRQEVLTAIYRVAHCCHFQPPRTLGELLAQEGCIMARAGCHSPTLSEEDLEYTKWVLEPYLESTDMRTGIQCLFGDEAGKTLGFEPLGLSHRAGLAMALHDAIRERCCP